MANHKSAKKRARQTETRRLRNKSYYKAVRTVVKQFRESVEEVKNGGDQSKAATLLKQSQAALMKAGAKGLIHKNNASRRVARLTHLFKTATGNQK